MLESLVINSQIINPSENKTIVLNTYTLHNKSEAQIPVHVFHSGKKGPTLLLSAGMHGEETNGIEIIRRIINRQEVKELKCGILITIPVINVVSFLYNSRDLPDGKDLNRCFPGSKNGSLGSRIAYDLMKHILPIIDFGVDFHTGGARINNYPQVRCTFDAEQNLELASLIGAPLTINSAFREGTLRKEASKKNKSILVFEGGESIRFDYLAINEGYHACLRLMNSLGMINVDVPTHKTIFIQDTKWIRTPVSGLFHLIVNNGSHVRIDEPLGVICNPFGEVEEKILAPFDGFVIGVNNQPVVNEGDALIHLGKE